jgi:uncharacterized protein YjiS (DUF1127 family)
MTTFARANTGLLGSGFERNFGAWTAGLRETWARFITYRLTVADLKQLNERQLADLGTTRGDISRFARSAVYGN